MNSLITISAFLLLFDETFLLGLYFKSKATFEPNEMAFLSFSTLNLFFCTKDSTLRIFYRRMHEDFLS